MLVPSGAAPTEPGAAPAQPELVSALDLLKLLEAGIAAAGDRPAIPAPAAPVAASTPENGTPPAT
jgi:hypothetical protein